MADYIIFEKKGENNYLPWSYETVLTFCRDLEYEPIKVTEETLFIVAQLREHSEEDKMRLLELTPTITLLMRDDPSLDSFLQLETVGGKPFRLSDLKINE